MMRPSHTYNLYSTPPGAPFLKSLAAAVLGGGFPRPGSAAPSAHDLGDWRIYVPTRRAASALRQAFLEQAGGALLLPRIMPLGDPEEDELLITLDEQLPMSAELAELPPAISLAERRLVLIQLIQRWNKALFSSQLTLGGEGGHLLTPSQAATLAGELARLMDEVDIGEAGWSGLQSIVPDSFAGNWQLTIEFLKIVTEHWPAYLSEAGLMSPMRRRNILIEARAETLLARPPDGPVIAAGSTGSVPATARLLQAVASLPQGAVVLPGLDRVLDADSWGELGPDHPQFGMKHLLEQLGISDRASIPLLPGCAMDRAAEARELVISELMRPASRTYKWEQAGKRLPEKHVRRALAGVELVSAPDAGAEARIIAIIMRGLLEQPEQTGALVTPDRNLARRVAAELGRWGIEVENSSGTPLRNTPAGIFLLLIIEAIDSDFAPQSLLALIKHKAFRAGLDQRQLARAARVLDLALRGIGARPGLDGLATSLRRAEAGAATDHHDHPARRRLSPADWASAQQLIKQLQQIMGRFAGLAGGDEDPELAQLLVLHAGLAEQMAVGDDGTSNIWSGRDGEAASAFLAALHDAAGEQDRMGLSDYAAFLGVLMRETPVRPRRDMHPRLFIWGTLEARLMQADVMILGGLNEGVWPGVTRSDPWLSRPMRTDMGLEPLERRIGLSAHDFAQFLAAPKVYLTRAEKVDGTPSVPSRWLLRLKALLGGLAMDGDDVLAARTPWLAWSQALSRPDAYTPRPAPTPRPPIALRPVSLSVTEIEKWIRDPYEIFARHVLELQPLDEIGAEPDARHKGILIHKIMQLYAESEPQGPPGPGAEQRLLAIADQVFAELKDWPDLEAYWRIRFAAIAADFIQFEQARRQANVNVHAEKSAAMEITGPHRHFTLRARADRIDAGAEGAMIYDYKTGVAPTKLVVARGLAPQMALEAALLAAGAFKDIPAVQASGLVYLQLKGGKPAMKISEVHTEAQSAMDLARRAMDDLKSAIALYDDPDTPYLVRRMAQYENRFTPYDHLARTKEWRLLSDTGEDS